MRQLLKYAIGFALASLVLALIGVLITAVAAPLFGEPFFLMVEKVGIGYFVFSVILLILGRNVRKQVSANIKEKALSASVPLRVFYNLLMSYDGVILTASAGLLLLLVPVVF